MALGDRFPGDKLCIMIRVATRLGPSAKFFSLPGKIPPTLWLVGFSDFRLSVEIANPAMGFQFLNLFFGQSTSVPQLAVPFHVPHRTHSRNYGRHGSMTQDIAQCRFRHLIQSNVKIGSNFLHAFIDLLFAVAPKEIAAEITPVQIWSPG